MKDGKIEDNWADIAIERINKFVPNAGQCSACGTKGTVTLNGDLVTPMIMEPNGNVGIGGQSYPQVMLHCNRCGYVRYFNYVLLTAEEPELNLDADGE